jgi:hypothetical protein
MSPGAGVPIARGLWFCASWGGGGAARSWLLSTWANWRANTDSRTLTAGEFRRFAFVKPLWIWSRDSRKMPKNPIDFDTVRKIGLTLPGVAESTMYGSPALKVRGQLLACIPSHRSAEPDSLVVRVDFSDRDELLAAAPDVYYVTDHYLGYASVLVRLSRVTPDILRDLLGMAHKFVTSAARRSRSRKRGKTTRIGN